MTSSNTVVKVDFKRLYAGMYRWKEKEGEMRAGYIRHVTEDGKNFWLVVIEEGGQNWWDERTLANAKISVISSVTKP